ncbi:MAG: hypothetical protein R2707_04460 [Acidimicrobiales bacterium]
MFKRSTIALFAAVALLAASCGDDGGADTASSDVSDVAASDASSQGDTTPEESAEDAAADLAEDMADDLAEVQADQGGGSATLTVGDQTWTFDSVLCAFGEEMIGQEGAVFNLSSIQDGLQMYASIDSFGHSLSLNDIKDFENPSVDLSSAFGAGEFIQLDGKDVTAEVGFMDGTSDDFAEIPGTFTATCP